MNGPKVKKQKRILDFKSNGILSYSTEPYRLIVEVDEEISRYYRSLVPKHFKIKKPLYPAHISLLRNQTPPNMDVWTRYAGQTVSFQYESFVYYDDLYFWLNVYSHELETVRSELGLPPWGDVSLSPDFQHRFHLTIGNLK